VLVGDTVLAGMGERIGADGVLASAAAQLDTSIVTGESLPENVTHGARIFAGSINLGAPITLTVTAIGEGTLLAECLRLIEAAEQARGRFVMLADRVARWYTPVVHIAALAVFLVWWVVLGRAVSESLMVAVSVLIITCPCALAIAIPAVQVVATSRLFRAGILLKSPTALERLAKVDTVVFDKTGTLTEPSLALAGIADPVALAIAAGMAVSSRHPLCRALVDAAGPVAALNDVAEIPGQGLVRGETRLGSRAFCGIADGVSATPELCLVRPGHDPVLFGFAERLRADAPETLQRLCRQGLTVQIASGDHPDSVARIAAALGVKLTAARQTPLLKAALIEALAAQGRHVLMVGDGVNDSPCLAAALVSAAPASATDISQTVADVVYQGNGLAPVAMILSIARRARRIMWQNLALSIGYNAIMLPLAATGHVTPWVAALAMSSSSIVVIANALRLQGGRL
jgi:P-type Cu2+ transporter